MPFNCKAQPVDTGASAPSLRTLSRVASRPRTRSDRLLASLHEGTSFGARGRRLDPLEAFCARAVGRF